MPDPVPELFLNHSVRKLEQMTAAIRLCLGKLSEEQIWRHAGANENAVGNLVLHLCGNVSQWIGHSVGGEPDTRNRPAEFSPGNHSRQALEEKLDSTVSHAVGILRALPPERLAARVPTQSGESSVLEAIYQVVGHFQQHTGQIIFATKQMTGEDLQIYRL
jgi:hypothetical protein